MRPTILRAVILMLMVWQFADVRADPTHPAGPSVAGVFGGAGPQAQPDPITGVMEASVVFELPKARGAAQPRLALSYNSSTTEREAGYGWGLSVHGIERRPLSGWPRYIDDGNPKNEDRYVFDGEPLVFLCVVGTHGCEQASAPMPLWANGWRAYRLQVEGTFARFFLNPARTTWRVQRKGGELLELGAPLTHAAVSSLAATEMGDNGKVFRWRLVRQVDIDGNLVVYGWQALGVRRLLYLTDVFDTPPASGITTLSTFANHTQLSWERPGFAITNYAKIDKAGADMRLTRVAVASMPWSGVAPRAAVRVYRLGYYARRGVLSYDYKNDAPLWHHSFLKTVQLEGDCAIAEIGESVPPSTQCERMPPTTFEYQTGELSPKGGFFHAETHDTPPGEDETNFKVLPWVESVAIVDLNRDGLPDVVQSWPGNRVVDVTNDGPFVRKKTGYLNIGDKSLLQIQLRHQCMDMGSGNPGDLAFYNMGKQAAFLTEGHGASVMGAWGDSPLLWSMTDYSQMTAKPVDAHPSFCDMFATDPTHGAWAWMKGDEVGWSKHQQGAPSPLARNHWFADVDGDGLPDSFNRTAGASIDLEAANVDFTRRQSSAQRGGAGAALIPFTPNFAASGNSLTPAEKPRPGSRFFYVDINGDGLVDLVTFNVDSDGGPNEFVPVVRPGDGRGGFGCIGNNEPVGVNCTTPPAGAPSWLTSSYFIQVPGAPKPLPFTDDTYIHDITGDGLADIIQYDPPSGEIRLWINQDGQTFLCAKPGGTRPCMVNRFFDGLHATFNINPHRVTFADMDANGIDDMVLIGNSGVWASAVYQTLAAVTPRAPRPGVLIRIDNGIGATTLIDYRTIQELDLAATADKHPWTFHSPQVVAVVARIRTVDARTATGTGTTPEPYRIDRRTTYDYADPAYDPWSRSFVGFRKVRVKEGFDQSITETTYWFGPCQRGVKQCAESSDDEPWKALSGRAVRVDRLVPEALHQRAERLLSTTLYEYANDSLFQTPDQTVRYAYARTIDTYLYDAEAPFASGGSFVSVANGDHRTAPATQPGRAHVRETVEMDGNGNLVKRVSEGRLREDGSGNPGVDGRITRAAVVGCNRSWQCLTRTETISADPVLGEPRTMRYSYDALGRMTLAEVDLKGSLPLDRHHEVAGASIAPPPATASTSGWTKVLSLAYDAFGNPTRIENGGAAASCVTVTYDAPYAQLPQTTESHTSGCSSRALSSSRVFHRGFGLIVAERSPTEGLTEIRLDAFGRPLSVDLPQPDSASVTAVQGLTFRYHDQSPLSWVAVARHTGSGTLDSIEVSNGLGESVFGFDAADPTAGDLANWVMRGWTERDSTGRVTRVLQPSFFSGNPVATVQTAATVPPPTSARRLDYSYDAFGRPTLVADGSVVASMYRYMPLATEVYDGEQSKPTGPRAGQHTTTMLDGHGRVARTAAVVKGDEIRIDTKYLATGEPWQIVQSHGASGDTVTRTLSYDSLGRIVRNVEPNTSLATGASWRYAWDDAGHMVGTSDARGCGENIFYDGLGRIVAEDYSPCLRTHEAYTAPNLATGDGTEAFFRYDDYEAGQVQAVPGFADNGRLAVSRLVSVQDRGAHTRINYDNRGRMRRVARRVAVPGTPAALLASRYSANWYESRMDYDRADRLVSQTTGADLPALLAGGASATSFAYSARGHLRHVASSYGVLLSDARFDADGSPRQFVYGDAAATKTSFDYDARRRVTQYTVSRSAPAIWGTATPTYTPPGLGTTQLQLQALSFLYDDAGNLLSVKDASPATEWPVGIQPTSRTVQYDDLYRTTRIDYAHGLDKQVSPFALEEANADRRSIPVRGGTRLGFQTFAYDWKGNITSSDDDRQVRYDRSLGATVNGEAAGKPNQFVSAPGIAAHHDAAGNLVDLTVERSGCPGATPSLCTHRFVYDWDEVGQLARATRWDYPGGPIPAGEPTYPAIPTTVPVWELRYAYSNGERVLKSVKNHLGDQRHTLDVFDTLRIDRAKFARGDYERKPEMTTLYLAGVGRVVHDASLPSPGNDPRHVFLLVGDRLGSTSAAIDLHTGELVERVTYQAFGAIESDYRPERWNMFREDVKFTGKEEDIEIGATYFGARYYSAHLGRFMSADPLTIHALGGDLNPYAYVGGRVTTRVDPLGLAPCGQDVPCEVEVKGPPRGSAERAAELATARAEARADSAMTAKKVTAKNLALGSAHIPIPGTKKAYFTPTGIRKVAANTAIDLLDPLKYRVVVQLFTGNPLAFHVGEDGDDKSAIVGAVAVTVAMVAAGRAGGPAPAVSAEEAGLRTLAQEVGKAGGFWARLTQTVSVLRTAEGPLLVGGGVRDLTPAQRTLANAMGLVPVRLAGVHAEGTVLEGAAKAGLTPLFGATTRAICWVCERDIVGGVLSNSGGQLTPSGFGFFFPPSP